MADAPMPSLQRRAWWSLALVVAGLGSITFLIVSKGGAAVYWNDDDLRLWVIGIFIATLLAHTFVLLVPNAVGRESGRFDERAEGVLARAPTAQPVAIILALAAWMIVLAQRFRAEGAVPVVYLYLIFGSILLVSFIGQSVGVLLGYWFGSKHGKG